MFVVYAMQSSKSTISVCALNFPDGGSNVGEARGMVHVLCD
jgi:hypothetical protein